jgi:hypothetical protein
MLTLGAPTFHAGVVWDFVRLLQAPIDEPGVFTRRFLILFRVVHPVITGKAATGRDIIFLGELV